ncbi:MAG: 5'/3'-nucleotidase SurE [Chlamydiia bacterium]|nr:5'/3'-nucleotidase SurE [Chlamydiia bacterium]
MHILLTNDDGIDAVGLRTLWESLQGIADLTIVAPMEEQSGMGMSVTYYGPLRAEKVQGFDHTPAWKIQGTPADCVKAGLGGILDSPPDLIVSGINHGSNAGRGIFSSGTAGCVIQGILQGVPGIAFSYTCCDTESFPHVKKYVTPIVQYVIDHPLPQGTFLNVNFPHEAIQGVKLARQGLSFWLESIEKKMHPEGHLEIHLGGLVNDPDEHPESDIALLKKGFVTAVPIHIKELTDLTHFEKSKTHFERHF